MFFSPFSIAITSFGEERANLSAFCTYVLFALVWVCLFPLPHGVWEELPFVIVALSGLSSHLLLTVAFVLSLLPKLRSTVFTVCIRTERPEQPSLDPNETPHKAAPHQGLLCLPLIQHFLDITLGSKLYLFKV